MNCFGAALSSDAIGDLLREFTPDILSHSDRGPEIRDFHSCNAVGMAQPEPDHSCTAECEAGEVAGRAYC